uniref:Photolyase/cryptochrome alpha/beta domain-containing protein n=1 Tax=viral metagenome TaxID=1070528 RepID=A0A6C0DW48_9ZZZZ
MPRIVVHIFHRDLRTVDNAALHLAAAKAKETGAKLVPLFVFTPEQVGSENKLKSTASIEFMLNSLDDLNEQLDQHLTLAYTTQLEALIDLVANYQVVAISEQRDYTPYAIKRETETLFFATQHAIPYLVAEDVYLTNPGTVMNKSKKMYQKFTPFYEAASRQSVAKPTPAPAGLTSLLDQVTLKNQTTLKAMRSKLISKPNMHLHVKGGRIEGLALLKTPPPDYTGQHDIPSIPTSNLSAHNHFGTVSIREVYHAITNEAFRRQLYWRDFYGHICFFFEALYKTSPYDFQKMPQPGWSTDKAEFKKWTDGKTGHALVDAGMRQLKATGYIHNRARLVAAIYLTKHLKIHWRWGEQHFARLLVDYDFAQNFGNWCWVASVLPFSMAPFRSLDPEIQLKKFDPKHTYVDRWLN